MQLGDPIFKHFRLTDSQKGALAKLGVTTINDLLFHLPFRFDAGGESAVVAGLTAGMKTSNISSSRHAPANRSRQDSGCFFVKRKSKATAIRGRPFMSPTYC